MQYLQFIILAIFLNSCSTSQETVNSNHKNNLKDDTALSGKYLITALGNEKPDLDLYIVFDSVPGKVSGFSGCNSFFGRYVLKGNQLSFSGFASTNMLCRERMNLVESKMMKLLSEVNNYQLDGNLIELNNGSESFLRAEKALQENNHQISQTITYEANTRGFYERIWISGNTLSFTNDRYAKAVVSNPIPVNDLEELLQLMDSLKPKILPNLEPPSKTFQYDGAAIATLKIENDSDNYQTPSFDHGNPPERIKPLVEKILDLKKSMVD